VTVVPILLLTACSTGTSGVPVPVRSHQVTTVGTTATRQPHILVFSATGDATVQSLNYMLDGRTITVSPATLPWRVSLSVPWDGARHTYSVTMNTASGDVQLLAILDGSVLTQTGGGGTGSGTEDLSGDFAG